MYMLEMRAHIVLHLPKFHFAGSKLFRPTRHVQYQHT